MRISDWSSDVCSSDLGVAKQGALLREREIQSLRVEIETLQEREHELERGIAAWRDRLLAAEQQREDAQRGLYMAHRSVSELAGQLQSQQRSEEHTSELQSLMRISYAVFCLEKKKILSD